MGIVYSLHRFSSGLLFSLQKSKEFYYWPKIVDKITPWDELLRILSSKIHTRTERVIGHSQNRSTDWYEAFSLNDLPDMIFLLTKSQTKHMWKKDKWSKSTP